MQDLDDKGLYLVKLKYTITDISKDKKPKKWKRERRKLYMMGEADEVQAKLKELEELLHSEKEENIETGLWKNVKDRVERFGEMCNQTYLQMLRT